MRDHSRLRAFELADEVALWVYRVTPERRVIRSDFSNTASSGLSSF